MFHWNRDKFPDPAALIARFAAAGVRLLANISPVLLMRLRISPAPYLASLLRRYRDDFEPVMRPVFHDFSDGSQAWEDTEDFMLGDTLLVCPVTEPGAVNREIRLPASARWRDAWSGEVSEGGVKIQRPALYAQPPYFVRLDPPDGPATGG